MTIRNRMIQGLCLYFLLITSCAETVPPEKIEPVQVQNISDTFKGEQGNIIRMYGFPDKASQSSFGITSWVYCSGQPEEVLIQFDKNGEILNVLPQPSAACFKNRR